MMEGNKRNKPRGLLVFGAPCSGKTTFAEKFAAKFGLTYYNLTELMEECSFSWEVMLMVLDLIARTGQTIVIEGGLDTEKSRLEVRNTLRSHGYEPTLVWVQTDAATIRNRMKRKYRSVAKAKTAYETAIAEMEAPSEIEKPVILSGKHTFETQTRHILTGLADI
ncbi:AAA family ATPase [Candidatus Saccharibacteria bacterium]|nr:AAA family ATPase [Candidatus Saccharibacteria bacterium]